MCGKLIDPENSAQMCTFGAKHNRHRARLGLEKLSGHTKTHTHAHTKRRNNTKQKNDMVSVTAHNKWKELPFEMRTQRCV